MRIDFNISQSERGNFVTACEAVIRNVGASTKAATEYAGWEIMSDSLGQVPVDTGTLISSAFLGVSERGDVKRGYVYGAVLGYGQPSGLSSAMGLGFKTKTVHVPAGPIMWQNGKVIKSHQGYSETRQYEEGMTWLMTPSNGVNPKNGLPASAYAGRIHEDLGMPHPNGGKAKFLEDPVRNWAAGKFARTAMTYWQRAIKYMDWGSTSWAWVDSDGKPNKAYASELTTKGKVITGNIYKDINWIRGKALRRRLERHMVFDKPRRVRQYTLTQTGKGTQKGGKTVYKGREL